MKLTIFFFFFFSFTLLGITAGLNAVCYGPQSRVLLLLTAKLAAREMNDVAVICESGAESMCRRFMYGPEYEEKGIDEENKAKPTSDPTLMETALKKANVILLTGHDNPIEEKAVNTLLNTAGEGLSKVVLVSQMGGSKAKGGFFGGGNSIKESEDYIRKVCQSKGLDLSIVRAGMLKGGGCGDVGDDFGLNKVYYNTLVDVIEASVTMAHDKYSLGADCTLGDTVEMPNMFTQMGSKSSFEPCQYDSNRIVVAGGAVAAALKDGEIEFSIGTQSSKTPPSQEDWVKMFDTME
ncbi:unnamed protein product [Cylindrotheca closterium]|uniref:NAD(P)-binding domain-containing protein n=1 Tax=Cylindrotheca closterium TaxID=2856 RepID=A0AAD2CFW2_9STRA|nr:unnamed protein product [Cylindrotheca closterium]